MGLVQRGVSLTNIAQAAAMEAASICCHALGACPEIRMSVDRSGDGLVAAVPEYVHYVVLELLKNAMRATMQAHGKSDTERQRNVLARGGGDDGDGRGPIVFADVPEVSISVRKQGEDDVLLVVGDHGGGIPAEATDKVTYAVCAVLFFGRKDKRALSWAEWYLLKRLVFTTGRGGRGSFLVCRRVQWQSRHCDVDDVEIMKVAPYGVRTTNASCRAFGRVRVGRNHVLSASWTRHAVGINGFICEYTMLAREQQS